MKDNDITEVLDLTFTVNEEVFGQVRGHPKPKWSLCSISVLILFIATHTNAMGLIPWAHADVMYSMLSCTLIASDG